MDQLTPGQDRLDALVVHGPVLGMDVALPELPRLKDVLPRQAEILHRRLGPAGHPRFHIAQVEIAPLGVAGKGGEGPVNQPAGVQGRLAGIPALLRSLAGGTGNGTVFDFIPLL